jgi:hypothetical protein
VFAHAYFLCLYSMPGYSCCLKTIQCNKRDQ